MAYILIDKEEVKAAYQDLTGQFLYKSSQGNEYVIVGYHYDANCILGHPVRDRKAPTLTAAWENLHNKVATADLAPEV